MSKGNDEIKITITNPEGNTREANIDEEIRKRKPETFPAISDKEDNKAGQLFPHPKPKITKPKLFNIECDEKSFNKLHRTISKAEERMRYVDPEDHGYDLLRGFLFVSEHHLKNIAADLDLKIPEKEKSVLEKLTFLKEYLITQNPTNNIKMLHKDRSLYKNHGMFKIRKTSNDPFVTSAEAVEKLAIDNSK